MIYFTSDTHFGHFNIIKYCNRPYQSIDEMDEALITNWNRTIRPNDIVYHLGDFCFSSYNRLNEILERLNGELHMIRGNHDRVIEDNFKYGELGKIRSLRDYHSLRVNHKTIIMSHYAFRVWDKSHHGSIHIYGHSHGTLPPQGLSVDVGVDCKEITPEYRPISLDELLEYMSKRQGAVVDHHGVIA